MSPEQLDEARAREAVRESYARVGAGEMPGVLPEGITKRDLDISKRAARLAREGWEPVDPDLIEARKVVADSAELASFFPTSFAHDARNGSMDARASVQVALAAIKRGRELERAALSASIGEKS